MRARFVAAVALILLTLVVPTAWAAGFFPDAHSDVQIQWERLFTQVFWAALVVFVLVQALLFYAMVRFRRRKDGPQEGPHIHGNTKMEIAWTIAPTLVMAWLLVVSLNGLAITDEPPPADFEVEVTGSRFTWTFTYPDSSKAFNTLHVEQGKVVKLRVVSKDVIHAFNVPSLGVMIDAVPGRTNFAWFKANEAGEYLAQCRELCGADHGKMRGSVVVFPAGSANSSFGDPAKPPPAAPAPTNGSAPQGDVSLKVDLGPGFRLNPATLTTEPGKKLVIEVTNVDGIPHNLFVGDRFNEGAENGGATWFTPTLDANGKAFVEIPLPPEPGAWEIWCNVGGHYNGGMKGILSTGGTLKSGGGPAPLLPGFELPLLFGALLVSGLVVRARRKANR